MCEFVPHDAAAPAADPFPANFDPLEVFELMAETAIAAGAEPYALRTLLKRIQAVTADA
jgi:hypothetical protein